MWLLIDDIRDLCCEAIARTPEAAKILLKSFSWEGLCLDHDLGDYKEDGYMILKWALSENCVPPEVQLVTSNPVGRKVMGESLIQAGYKTIDGINFKR